MHQFNGQKLLSCLFENRLVPEIIGGLFLILILWLKMSKDYLLRYQISWLYPMLWNKPEGGKLLKQIDLKLCM